MLILYAYDTNTTLVKKKRSDADVLRAFDVSYDTLENTGQAPKLNIMENESSTVLKSLYKKGEHWYN